LDDAEVRALWEACDRQKTIRRDGDGDAAVISPPVARLLQFLLVTGQGFRPNGGDAVGDVDAPNDWQTNRTVPGAWWTIPGKHTTRLGKLVERYLIHTQQPPPKGKKVVGRGPDYAVRVPIGLADTAQ
jgi:hypothetical protein